MNKFQSFKAGISSKPELFDVADISKLITNKDLDYYSSLYFYNDEHLKRFKDTGSVSGIKDTSTNILYFDFDYKDDLELARTETIKLLIKLIENFSIPENSIRVCWSGYKGFSVEVFLNQTLTPLQFKVLTVYLAGEYKSFDRTINDPNRVIRIINTKHQTSGLYKIYLSFDELEKLSIEEIKQLAKEPRKIINMGTDFCVLPKELQTIVSNTNEKVKNETTNDGDEFKTLDWSKKPNTWKNCKWALLQGYFEPSQRHNALTRLAATCRGLGYDKELTYYMCKSALKKQAVLYNQEEFPKEELWNNIIEQSIFADSWEGGTYSCRTDEWLKNYCEQLGEHKCEIEPEQPPCITVENLSGIFHDFSNNFEKNVIKTGITSLDVNVMFPTYTLVGILGQPGSGKTSAAINFLRNTSINNIDSVLMSLDMGPPLLFGYLLKREAGYDFRQATEIWKNDPKLKDELLAKIKDNYKNVGFNFLTGVTVNDIKRTIIEHQQKTGKQVKLVVVDYLECLAGPHSDPTANSGLVANQLKDVANELGVCIVVLLQTQKHSTPEISDPLLSMKAVKGSSLIEQSCSVILTMWRDGYNPDTVKDDKYMSIAAVKNRFGSLWRGDFHWNGRTGLIRELTDEELLEFEKFKENKTERRELSNAVKTWR